SDAPLLPGPQCFANVAVQDLADGAAGQFGPEKNRFWSLDRTEAAPAEAEQLLRIGAVALLQLHDRGDRFSPFGVGRSDHGAILDRRLPPENLLDFRREDVVATRDDEVARAIDQVVKSFLVAIAK